MHWFEMHWYWIVGGISLIVLLAIIGFSMLSTAKRSDEDSEKLLAELKGTAPAKETLAEEAPVVVAARPVVSRKHHQAA